MAQIEAMTRLKFLTTLSAVRLAQEAVVVYDVRLERVSPEFRAWIRTRPLRMGVVSGEGLKDLSRFPGHVAKFSKIAASVPARRLEVVAIGGGSVGDFAGFLASVYKRGVDLIHVPSTWLAALDSSHGGKTALNVAGAKNQIGTFHPAREVLLVKSLLVSQPEERALDAMAELAKIALIDGGAWAKQLASSRLSGSALIWKFLAPAIKAKMKIVSQDPNEKKGLRQILNFGHTFGHVIEAELGWTHGRSVAQGLFFALELGESMKITNEKEFERAQALLGSVGLSPERPSRPMSSSAVRSLLTRDKKRDSRGDVTFVFLRRWGRIERKNVAIDRIVDEGVRLGWVKP